MERETAIKPVVPAPKKSILSIANTVRELVPLMGSIGAGLVALWGYTSALPWYATLGIVLLVFTFMWWTLRFVALAYNVACAKSLPRDSFASEETLRRSMSEQIQGQWLSNGQKCSISLDGQTLIFQDEKGARGYGGIGNVHADGSIDLIAERGWKDTGCLAPDWTRIDWTNGTWQRTGWEKLRKERETLVATNAKKDDEMKEVQTLAQEIIGIVNEKAPATASPYFPLPELAHSPEAERLTRIRTKAEEIASPIVRAMRNVPLLRRP